MEDKTELNRYLYYEFGPDGDEESVSENWPFELTFIGTLHDQNDSITVYQFQDNDETFFALSPGFDLYPTADMNLEDLQLQEIGSAWIGGQNPIDMDTVFLGDDSIPASKQRQEAIERMVTAEIGHQRRFELLEGLYLQSTKKYLALVQVEESEDSIMVGDGVKPRRIEFPKASPWRRLAFGIGQMLAETSKPNA